jgi:hypothetical protein
MNAHPRPIGTAGGEPIAILEAGRTMITAFIQAGVMAMISIGIML